MLEPQHNAASSPQPLPPSVNLRSVQSEVQGYSPHSTTLSAAIDCDPLRVTPEMSLLAVITLMSQGNSNCLLKNQEPAPAELQPKRSSCVLVIVDENLLGILTERDVVKLVAQGRDLSAITVADVMTQKMITLQESDLQNSFAVLSVFQKHRIRHLPILNELGQVIGVATLSSIRRTLQFTNLFRLRRVEEVMSTQLISAPPETSVIDLAQLMATHPVSCVVITQKGASSTASHISPLGIVTERDIVQFQALGLNLKTIQTQLVMSTPLICLNPQDDLWSAHQTMERLRVRRLVVSDTQGALVGILTQTSILATLDPLEMQKTITVLKQQVDQLQDERMQGLKNRASDLESKVQSTEQRFQAIFNQTFQFIGLLEPDGTLIEINQTALDFSGFQREEVIGRPFWEKNWWQNSPETQQQLKNAIARAAQGEFVRYEVDVLGGAQSTTIDFSLRPMLDEAGRVKLLIPEGRDISERKVIEGIKDEFVSVVSHELRTPLTSIHSALQLLETGKFGALDPQGQKLLNIAVRNTQRLGNLINDVLNLKRIESGEIVMSKQHCNVADLMTQATQEMRAMASEQAITLITNPLNIDVNANPEHIMQTLTNLLNNAIKFSSAHGSICLSVLEQDHAIRFEIRDQGRGIPSDKLEKIFERFQQVDASDTRQKGGTGLGLTICRQIVERHGGQIWAESIEGEGSSFYFTLPKYNGVTPSVGDLVSPKI